MHTMVADYPNQAQTQRHSHSCPATLAKRTLLVVLLKRLPIHVLLSRSMGYLAMQDSLF